MDLIQTPFGQLYIRPNTTDLSVINDEISGHYNKPISRKKNAVIVDLGGNIGSFLAMYEQEYGIGFAISVEPNPDTFQVLWSNVCMLGLNNRTMLLEAAIANSEETQYLHDLDIAWGTNATSEVSNHPIRCITMNKVLNILNQRGYSEIDFCKIDIEGGEFELFMNNTEWLECVHELYVQFHPVNESDYSRVDAVAEIIKKHGFYSIEGGGKYQHFVRI